MDIELNVCDTQPSCLGGGNNEFIFSGRLDNLASSYCALRALIDSSKSDSDLSSEHAIRMVALFDNEEVIAPYQQSTFYSVKFSSDNLSEFSPCCIYFVLFIGSKFFHFNWIQLLFFYMNPANYLNEKG